jgi:hypothetical protein
MACILLFYNQRKDSKMLKNTGQMLELLSDPVSLDLSLDDLRIIVGCFHAIEYQMEMDNEPYLDGVSLELKQRLETAYERTLKEKGVEKKVS